METVCICLYGDSKIDQVSDLYIKASEMSPQDAMEKLDIESALAELGIRQDNRRLSFTKHLIYHRVIFDSDREL